MQHFDQASISPPPVPFSLNNSITCFLSLFWSLMSSSVFFCALTRSSFFCVMFACICFFCFFFSYLWALAGPVLLWRSPRERAVFRRASPPSASLPLSPLPLSWKAFTRAHWAPWAPWRTVGASRGERGCSDSPPYPCLDPNALKRRGWVGGTNWFWLGWQFWLTCCLSKPFNARLFPLYQHIHKHFLVKIQFFFFFLLPILLLLSPSSCVALK